MKTTTIRLTEYDEANIDKIKNYLKLYKVKASTTTVIRALISQETELITKRTSKGLHMHVDYIKSNK